ncbi:hypothetical protein DV735_g445, partial [Chaetothyriales sp. CBS 134920]
LALTVACGKLLSPDLADADDMAALQRRRLTQLHTLAWRLVRHDLSEDLVLRPAFEQYLGAAGKAMSNHDRADHERARVELLRLCGENEYAARLEVLRQRYAVLMAGLAEHMRSESGEDIPRLEAAMGPAQSVELGRRYLETMVVQPELQIAGARVWPDVGAYLTAGLQGLRSVWTQVLLDRERRGEKPGGKL